MLYKEIVYFPLEELKGLSGDFDYTEDHILFLADKYRAFLLERKYATKTSGVSSENYQEICFNLEKVNNIYGIDCSETLLRTTTEIPDIMDFSILNVSPNTVMESTAISVVPFERLSYVGQNKWTSKLIFAARGRDNHLYLRSSNPQFLYLSKIRVFGVFSDTRKAFEASCNGTCDIMEQRFPIEEDLTAPLIQYIVQELSGQRYMPRDKQNNSSDDMAGMASATPRNINRTPTTNA